jgi:DNA-binding MurR/RpiR family transcriptional regulator
MDAPRDYESLKRRLIEVEPSLPKRLRQTAAFALDHPDEIALGTASRVAQRADVQASTLVRFAQALGFAGFSDLQALFRAHMRTRWPDYSQRLEALHQGALASGDPLQLLAGFADSAAASLAKLRRSLHRDELEAALVPLVRARLIYVVGQRRAFSVAHYLVYALAQLGIGAALIDDVGGLGREQLAAAGDDDALIAISFAPYAPFTLERVKAARAGGTPIVVVTDSALSPLAGFAEARLEVAESDFGSFRSLAATFCLAMTLAVAVAERRREAAAG